MSARLGNLLEFVYQLPIGFVEFEADGTLLRVNPTVPRHLLPLVGPQGFTDAFALLAPLLPELSEQLETGSVTGPEASSPHLISERRWLTLPDGSSLALQATISRLDDHFVAIITDVSPEADALARIETLFEQSSDGVSLLTGDGTMYDCNPTFGEMLGYTRDEAKLLTLSDWEHSLPGTDVDRLVRDRLANPGTIETQLRHRDGRILDAEINVRPVTLGANTYLYVAARDVSQRKSAERELLELKTRYEQFFENNASMKLVIDPANGAIVQANSAACAFYGYSREHLTGLNISDINCASSDEIAADSEAAEREDRIHCEFRHRLASGEVRDVEVYSGPVEIGQHTLLYSVIHDVTDKHRQAEEISLQLRKMQTVLDGTEAGTWEWNAQTDEFRHDERWAEMLGYTRGRSAELKTGAQWDALSHPEDLLRSDERLANCLRGESPRYRCSCRMRHRDGHWVWVLETGRIFTWTDGGEPEWMYGTQLDITSFKDQESAAAAARDRMESIAEATNAGIVALTADGKLEFLNRRFMQLLGYTEEDLADRETWIRRVSADVVTRQTLSATLINGETNDRATGGRFRNQEIRLRTSTGLVRNFLLSELRSSTGSVLTFADVTQQKHHEEYIEFVSRHDVLTGLPNRALLAERLEWQMKQTRRSRWMMCVAFLDLDGFKPVNDTYGHEAGDQVLKTIAARLKHAVREVDTVARLGGDEFAVVLTEVKDRREVVGLIERLLEAVRSPIPFQAHLLRVSGSIGLTFYSQGSDIVGDQLLRQADKAMYDAKTAGKDRYSIFDAASNFDLREHHRSLDQIRAALVGGALELHFQPKAELQTGLLAGAEALLRWRLGSGDLLAPDEFLPQLLDHELSLEVGRWVLARAFADLDQLMTAGLSLQMSINVFPRQIVSTSFVTELRELLEKYPRIDPGQIELEVVETAVLHDVGAAGSVMRACRDLGVCFALDDFGTGFSSLTHLKHLPVSTLKIDKSFAAGMLHDPGDHAIVEGTLSLARAFGLSVVVEGVENSEQVSALMELKCDRIQGYAIARPMPLDEFRRYMMDWRVPELWQTRNTERQQAG